VALPEGLDPHLNLLPLFPLGHLGFSAVARSEWPVPRACALAEPPFSIFCLGNALTIGLTASRCQKAAWKDHKSSCVKKSCREELDLAQVWGKVSYAHETNDWQGVLVWEGSMEALLGIALDDKNRVKILAVFAYTFGRTQRHAEAAGCYLRKVDLLGALQLFRDQVMPKAEVSEHLHFLVEGGLVSTETILKAIPGLSSLHHDFCTKSRPNKPSSDASFLHYRELPWLKSLVSYKQRVTSLARGNGLQGLRASPASTASSRPSENP